MSHARAARRGLDPAVPSILAVFALEALAFGSWLPRIPELKAAFGLSEGALGAVLLGVPLGALVAMPLAGWLSTRMAPRALNLRCMAAMLLAIALIGWAPSAAGLAAILVLVGLGTGAIDLAMNVAGFAIEERRGRPILSTCHAFFSIGMAAGGALGGAMVWAAVPIPLHLIALNGTVLAAVLLALPGLPAVAPPRGDGAPSFALPGRALMVPAAILFFGLMAEGAVQDWSAVFLAEVLAGGGLVVGLGLTIFAGSMALVRLVGDPLSDRFGSRLLIGASAAAAGAGLAIVALAPGTPVALMGFALTGAGLAAIVPVTFRLAGRRSPGAPGLGVAAAATPGYLGFLLGPALVGLLAEAGSLRWSFAALAASMALVAALSPSAG